MIRPQVTGSNPYYYGFVVFQHKENAKLAIKEENGKLWMDKTIRVLYAKENEEKRVFEIIVSHIPLTFTEEQISDIFSQVAPAASPYITPPFAFLIPRHPSLVRDTSWDSIGKNLLFFSVPKLLSEVPDSRAMSNR
jgi:hypothetical protein